MKQILVRWFVVIRAIAIRQRLRMMGTAAFVWGALTVVPGGAASTDPGLGLSIQRSGTNAVLSWFGANAVAYQLESSTTLTSWVTASPVFDGRGAMLSTTVPFRGGGTVHFRLKRTAPGGAATAAFNPATGILTITGTVLDDTLVVGRDGAGLIFVNDGALPVTGGIPTVASTVAIQINGLEGDDHLALEEANGALPKCNLFGDAGNDTLVGGSAADVLNGGTGADTLFGHGGVDTLIGGDGDDVVTGGASVDTVLLGAGDDRFVWNPGDGTDLIEGGDDTDTVEVNGGNGSEDFTTTANGTRVRFDRLNPAPFTLDIGACERLVLNASGGDDSFTATGNLAALIQILVDGGPGNDRILGSNGNDTLLGGDDDDFVDGQQGADTILLGAGNDIVQWDPGDGSDTVEGGDGDDTLVFNGSNIGEVFDVSADGSRLRFSRNIGNIVLGAAGVERVQCNALGGADIFTVNDLSPTEVTAVDLNLATFAGSGDAAADTVIIQGTPGPDNIMAGSSDGVLSVGGLKPRVTVRGGETNDLIVVNALSGNDAVDFSSATGPFLLTLDGGPGNDVLVGGPLADRLNGGDEADTLIGGPGNDIVMGGAGDDTFIWNPGDGDDAIEGQDGADVVRFNGSDTDDDFDLNTSSGRLFCYFNSTNGPIGAGTVESVAVNAFGGTDSVNIGDLQLTSATNVLVTLAAADSTTGDGATDAVFINGTQAADFVTAFGDDGTVRVLGLPTAVTITGADAARDQLTLNLSGGDDQVDASGVSASAIARLSLFGSFGNDELIGGECANVLSGGDGDDVLYGGVSDDTVVWNPGDDNDVMEGRTGFDTLQFNGANIAEAIVLSADGSRLRLSRNVGNVSLDGGGIERVQFNAHAGTDLITVNDLASTSVRQVGIALSALGAPDVGDGQSDTVVINGTAGNDSITAAGAGGSLTVLGLAPAVTITGAEPGLDNLMISTLAGDDIVEASALAAGCLTLTLDGGIDADLLVGSAGVDVLYGDEGDDVLIGGPGIDVLDGGSGNNVVIQD